MLNRKSTILLMFSLIILTAGVYFFNFEKNISQVQRTQDGDIALITSSNKALSKKATKGLVSEKKKKVKGLEGKDNPNLFAEWFNGIKTKAGQSVPDYVMNYQVEELLKAKNLNSTMELRKSSAIQEVTWTERGPGNVAGRTRSILVDPADNNSDTWIVGSVGGGVWKTTDAGQNWINLTENLPNLATSALGWSTSNTNIIYVGTGEGFGNVDQIDGSGIWKTINGGTTWQQLTATATNPEFENVMRLAVDPDNADIIIAAVAPGFNYLSGTPTSGIYRSIDGGVNWNKTYDAGSNNVEDLRANPQNFNTQMATINGTTVIKSKDGGQSWAESAEGIGPVARMELAYSPSDTTKVYISAQGGASGSILYGSDDGGETWFGYNDAVANVHWLGGQGWYDNTIAVNPFNPDRVFVGGIQLWQLDLAEGVDTSDAQILGVDQENTMSFLAFVNWDGGAGGGGIYYGYNFFTPVGVVEDDYSSIEIRFGDGVSQKAHRFVFSNPNFIYHDYVDVPFEVWDIDNNQQLMVSFRDHENNGTFDLEDRATDTGGGVDREYIFINAVPYNDVTADVTIAQNNGNLYKNTFAIWPEAPAGTGIIDFNTINFDATLRINYGVRISKILNTTNITDGYGQFGGSSKGVHVDHHNLIMVPTGFPNFRFINGNDGGIAFSDDQGASFSQTGDFGRGDPPNEILMGYNTTQFYGIDKANGIDRYIGGTQDNGSWISPLNADAASVWEDAPSGDGFEAVWHYGNVNMMLESSQYNSIYRTVDGGANWSWIGGSIDNGSASAPFFTKIAKSKQDPDLVFAMGISGVWRSDNFGETWSLIPMPAGFNGASSFSQIKISLSNPQIVWSARNITAASPPYVSVDGGLSFNATNYYSEVGLNRVSGFETHPTEDSTAFALSSMSRLPKILKTTDLGQTWIDISGFGTNTSSSNGFPDVAVFSLLVMPYNTDIIWAGTEIGLFESLDGGGTWAYADNGFPAVAVYDMLIVNDEVVVATHGRGVWSGAVDELIGYEPPAAILSPRALISGGAAGLVSFDLTLPSAYDSTVVVADGNTVFSLGETSTGTDTSFQAIISIEEAGTIDIFINSYVNGRAYRSSTTSLDVFPLANVAAGYSQNFATGGIEDFVFDGLEIGAFGINGGIHSLHPYFNGESASAMLIVPVVVAADNATLSYDDIAIVEPGDPGTVFGDEEFWDYVVVEGSSDLGLSWTPVADGYDASYNAGWLAANPNGPGDSTMFVNHEIDLLNTFSAGDTILIRFRLFADGFVNGWGWAIDNIEIQSHLVTSIDQLDGLPTEFSLSRNFPNPFNPTTSITYTLAKTSDVKIQVFNALGQIIKTLVNEKNQAAMKYDISWDGSNELGKPVASGLYFYKMEAGTFLKSYKMILLK